MEKTHRVPGRIVIAAAAMAIGLSYGSAALAQGDSPSPAEQARQAQITDLKAKIDNLQGQLKRLETAGASTASGSQSGTVSKAPGCCAGGGQMAQAGGGGGGGEGEHPMGGGMGGMGMGASPAATPGGMPMEEHMKGMQHMHGMMHGGEASPGASPGTMAPMGHPSEGMGGTGHGGGGMGGGGTGGGMEGGHGMGSGGMEGHEGMGSGGGASPAQPQASPSSGMQGDM